MAQFFSFAPSQQGPQQFTVILDGQSHTCAVPWSLHGRRWYISLTNDQTGLPVVYRAAVPSSQAQPLNLIGGYFETSAMFYDYPNSQFVATP